MTAPLTEPTGVTHERTALPSTCTVQAPHCATPQPNLVPGRFSSSRSTHSKGISGSMSIAWDVPLTVSFMSIVLSVQ
ncbi:hypothetical protein D3C71_2015490 [compost metagenome]